MVMEHQNLLAGQNYPIICDISNRWLNYYSRQQGPTDKHISKIFQWSLHSWTMYIMKLRIKYCHYTLKSLASRLHNTGNPTSSCLIKQFEANIDREYVGLLGIAVQSNSSNCPVIMPHRQLDKCLLRTRQSHGLKAQHFQKTFNKLSLQHIPNKLSTH